MVQMILNNCMVGVRGQLQCDKKVQLYLKPLKAKMERQSITVHTVHTIVS